MALTNELPTNESAATARTMALPANGKAKAGRKSKAVTKGPDEAAGSHRKVASARKTIKPSVKPVTQAATETKTSIVLKKLNSPKGVTIEALMEATGWQAHSVRGFLSAMVRKKLGQNLNSETGKDGVRRYRIEHATTNAK